MNQYLPSRYTDIIVMLTETLLCHLLSKTEFQTTELEPYIF